MIVLTTRKHAPIKMALTLTSKSRGTDKWDREIQINKFKSNLRKKGIRSLQPSVILKHLTIKRKFNGQDTNSWMSDVWSKKVDGLTQLAGICHLVFLRQETLLHTVSFSQVYKWTCRWHLSGNLMMFRGLQGVNLWWASIPYNTRYMAKQNFYKYKVRTNTGKQSVSFTAIDIWKDIPSSFKNLSVFAFPKQIKRYLLSEQELN